MELGTGLFLSSLCISLVWLFSLTKDRWNWKKVVLFPLATLLIAGAGVYAYLWYVEQAPVHSSMTNPTTHIEAIEGVALGMTMEDIYFRKGIPDEIEQGKEPGGMVAINYEKLGIAFKDDVVTRVYLLKPEGITPV